jgi:two-component system OmpR family sensor kinase
MWNVARRSFLSPRRSLRRVALRTKLVAAVLVLVFAALALISLASTYAVHRYLISRTDDDLRSFADAFAVTAAESRARHEDWAFDQPDYLVAVTSVAGVDDPSAGGRQSSADLPAPLSGPDEISAHVGAPYTARSANGKYRWRLLVIRLDDDTVLRVGQRLTGIDEAIARVVRAEILIGAGVLIALGAVGAALVRQSLIALVRIGRTAAAIGAGDLTRRLPDPEGRDGGEPTTDLGRLSRALNAMLAQIEAAFIARAQAERSARQAAEAAQISEARALTSQSRALSSEATMRQFVADASHELRTPLTTIRAVAERYRQGTVSDPADVAKLVRRIEDEAVRMGLLVEDLLRPVRRDRP